MTICFSMTIGAHILVEKLIVTTCANCWLCGCEELCAEMVITWQVVGYLRCMICHELA